MSNYQANPTPNYMTSDWGSSQQKLTAMQTNHIADKAQFAITMIESVVNHFDTIEKEIVDMSNSTVQPTREGIRAFSYRIDAQQSQIKEALRHLKEMLSEVKETTNKAQQSRMTW